MPEVLETPLLHPNYYILRPNSENAIFLEIDKRASYASFLS